MARGRNPSDEEKEKHHRRHLTFMKGFKKDKNEEAYDKLFWTAVVAASDNNWDDAHFESVLEELGKFVAKGGTVFADEIGTVFPSYVKAVVEADNIVEGAQKETESEPESAKPSTSLKRKKVASPEKVASPGKKTPGMSSSQQLGQLMAAQVWEHMQPSIEKAAKGAVAATLDGDNLVQRVQALEKRMKLVQDSLFCASGRK